MKAAAKAAATAAAKVVPDVPVVSGVDLRRCRRLNKAADPTAGPVLYWMSRDQRAEDNWALLYAQKLAIERSAPLHVAFCVVPKYLDATWRQFDFMLRGLREVEAALKDKDIPFHLRIGPAAAQVPKLCEELKVTTVVSDFSPLRVPQEWSQGVADACQKKDIPVIQLDAHNIVPVWCASDHQEYAARTIRSKIMNSLKDYLTPIPALQKHPHKAGKWPKPADWAAAEKSLQVDRSVAPVKNIVPGAKAAKKCLEEFCKERLAIYNEKRNDPNTTACSGLSQYLNMGQISTQRCALRVREFADGAKGSTVKGCEGFIEESVVRRELSDNFCFYNEKYDSLEGASAWAQKTLKDHEKDKREWVYTRQQLENAATHDDLWNASQLQVVNDGEMHGFLRMYWAKKILEWSKTPAEALETAIYFNDRFALDGCDPNGYVGCMWSIAGIHDMGWTERPIFGKIRFMNYAGCKRKLNIPKFVEKHGGAVANGEPPAKKAKK